MDPVRVLYILGGAMLYGGTEAFIMNYYRHIDHNKVQIDFIYQGDEPGVYDAELLASGSRIYHVPHKFRAPVAFSREVARIIREQDYKIIHSQMDAMGVWPLAIAKRLGVAHRIAHSHNTAHQTKNPVKKCWNDVAKWLLCRVATDFYACGEEAGRFLFGHKRLAAGQVRVIRNAIDLQSYAYCQEKRERYRQELQLGSGLVLGHVGQFREQKNHRQLLEIFAAVCKAEPAARLVLVGDGALKEEMEALAQTLDIRENVVFTGARNDVKDLMNAFDIFVFPSLFEGLSVVAIEAQANGLSCVFSDTVDPATVLTNHVQQLSLDDSAETWTEKLLQMPRCRHSENTDLIRRAGYDISIEAEKLTELYCSMA